MPKLEFNIPGTELQVKLSSATFIQPENKQRFIKSVENLIAELVTENFELIANFSETNKFLISISRLPSESTKTYQINIDLGVFRYIYDGLYIVLSDNDLFTGLGKSSGNYNVPTLEVPDWDSMDIAMANSDDVLFDVDRYNLHDFLYTVCLSFLIRHEIRHIANGHIDYLYQRQHSFDEYSGNGLTALDSQTLEMDVDSCVFAGMIEGFLHDPKQQALMPKELQNNHGIFMTLQFALQFLLYCMPSKKTTNQAGIEQQSHPNAYLRYFFSITTGLSLLKEKYPELLDVFTQVHQENFWNFLECLAAKGLIKMEPITKDFEWTMSDEGMTYADRIWNNWDHWIPKLGPLAYLQLAPPNQE